MIEQTGFTLEGRVLCSDGACIGTVGADRRCRICGKLYEGDEFLSVETATTVRDDPPVPEPEAAETSADFSAAGPIDPEERQCCPNDACIGIIGPDGRCGTCGMSAKN